MRYGILQCGIGGRCRLEEQNDYIDIKNATKTYGVSRTTLYRYIDAGKLKDYKRGFSKRTWLKKSEIEALIDFKPNR